MIPQIIISIVSYDIWFYISHIILHTHFFYKTVHKDHHITDCKKMIFTDTYVGHYLEGPFQGIGVFFPYLFIKPDIRILICSLILINIRGMLRHDHNYIWIIGNHHILHHRYPQYNFGEYWLDKLFGTDYPNKQEYQSGMIYW